MAGLLSKLPAPGIFYLLTFSVEHVAESAAAAEAKRNMGYTLDQVGN